MIFARCECERAVKFYLVYTLHCQMSLPCAADERRRVLEELMAAQGMEIRPDSSLCKCFIAGTLDPSYTAETVTFLCGLHKFLYLYTPYSARCSVILPAIANGLSSSLGSYDSAWKYVVQHEAPLLKLSVLEEVGGVPTVWPWLEQQQEVQK